MKVLSAIMAMIFLVLSCIPCSDAKSLSVCYKQTHSLSTSKTEHSDNSEKEHKDLCSPFCQCSCCTVAITLPFYTAHEAGVKLECSDKVFPCYLKPRPVAITLPVWQPPRLV